MKKTAMLIVFALSVFSAASVEAAQDKASVSLINGKQWAVVSGLTALPFQNVSIRILPPDSTLSANPTAADYNNIVDAVGQAQSKRDLTYSGRLLLPDTPEGTGERTYSVLLAFEDGTYNAITFQRADLQAIVNAFEVLKTTQNAATAVQTLIDYGEDIGVDLTQFKSLPSASRQNAADKLLYARDTQAVYTSASELEQMLNAAVAVQKIVDAADGNAVKALLTTYDSIFNVKPLPIYIAYQSKLTDVDMLAVYGKLVPKNEMKTVKDVQYEIEVGILCRLIERKQNWYDVKDVVETYGAPVLGLNLSLLSGVDRTAVYKEMNGKAITPATAGQVFEAAVRAVRDGAGYGGGNGGGGGSHPSGNDVKVGYTNSSDTPTSPGNGVSIIFPDVKEYAPWAYDSVTALLAKGIVTGRGGNIFDPQNSITREEFVTLIVRMSGLETQNADSGFEDAKGSWSEPYLSAARANGIITGTSASLFGVGQPISRQDMAVIILRAAKPLGLDGSEIYPGFDDEWQIADYAKDAVAVLAGAKIINGKGGNLFDPAANATRAESAHLVYVTMKSLNLL
jgi:hypothetical protein